MSWIHADYSTLTSTKSKITDINEEMNTNSELVSKCMDENKLCLNASKTHLMIACTIQRLGLLNVKNTVNIEMGGHKLVESEGSFEKILGVNLQSNLKWNSHIQEVMNKLKL